MPRVSEKEIGLGRKGVERGTSPLKSRGALNESDAPAALPWNNFRKSYLFVLALVIIGVTLFSFQRKVEAPRQENIQVFTNIGGQKIFLEVADEVAEQTKGLSGRTQLVENRGMLFVFDELGSHCMWMKDMNFALDMIWLDDQKKIVNIVENVGAETYPETFCSEKSAKYVIELNAGITKKADIKVGNQLNFYEI